MHVMTTAEPREPIVQTTAAPTVQRRCSCTACTGVEPVTPTAFAQDFSRVPTHANPPVRTPSRIRVSAPGDVHEREAEAAADRAMQAPDADRASDRADQPRAAQTGHGNLDRATQSFMQRRLGGDFSGVRIHTDAPAAQMSERLGAEAFTVGRDIYFAPGRYAPSSDRGRHLLAHELTHTMQQGQSRVARRSSTEQGVTGLVEVPEEAPQHDAPEAEVAEDAAVEGTTVEPMIQRSTKWNGATPHETVNMAEMALGGSGPITWEMLNGTLLKTDADADRAINKPTVTTSGTGTAFTAKVATVPAQEGGADETILSAGPWTKATTKAAAGRVTGLAACAGAGASTLTVNGQPSDDSVFKANRKHEDHHVTDDKAVFEDAIGKWDTKVQDALDKGTEFRGTSAPRATAALWAAMGNTPEKAARKYHADVGTKGDAYHGTATGGPMALANPSSNAACTTAALDVTNPRVMRAAIDIRDDGGTWADLQIINDGPTTTPIHNPGDPEPTDRWEHSRDAYRVAMLRSFGFLSITVRTEDGDVVEPAAITTRANHLVGLPVELAPGDRLRISVPLHELYSLESGAEYSLAMTYGDDALRLSAETRFRSP